MCANGRALVNFLLFATTHAKAANIGSDKMMVARYHIHYFFQKGVALPQSLLEN